MINIEIQIQIQRSSSGRLTTISHTFQDFVKLVFWLHTARTENPDNPQTHPSTSDLNEYHSRCPQTTPRHPPDTPKASLGNITCQQTLTDANRRQQTLPDTQNLWQVLFENVWWCLLAFVVVCWHVVFPGAVWGVSGGCLGVFWVVFMEIGVARLRFGCIWVLCPCSMEPKY